MMHSIAINISFRFLNRFGHSSTQAVMKPSTVQNLNKKDFNLQVSSEILLSIYSGHGYKHI